MSEPRLFDTHCHVVEGVFGDQAGVDTTLQRARQAGVARFLVIGSGYGAHSAAPAMAVAARHDDVWATAGVHPHDASHHDEVVQAELEAAVRDDRVVAVGEAGLDFHYDQSPREDQRRSLRCQARLALRVGLPLIVHDRDSEGQVLAILQEEDAFSGAGVLWHCFTGDVDSMQGVIDAGGYISLSGIVTFKSAGALRRVARAVPADRLLIETDSPWLAPVPVRGKRNEPANVRHVAAAVARCRNQSTAEIAHLSWENACRLFELPTA